VGARVYAGTERRRAVNRNVTTKQVSYIVVAGMAGFAILLYTAFRIGPFASPSVTTLGSNPNARPGGRPGQGIARANAVHKTHVGAAVACSDCHEREGETRAEHRCARCHEDRATRIHVALADADARECLSCHDFLHLPRASVIPGACPTCHVGSAPNEAPTRLSGPPQVTIHAGEYCGGCHAPHGSEGMRPRSCVECHAEQATQHGGREAKGAAVCLGCHFAHQRANVQKAKCLDCHGARVRSSALFAGHDRCVGCHAPHEFTRKTAKRCGECHEDRVGKTAAARRRHGDCTDCHSPHSPRRGLRSSCAECHAGQKTSHPLSKAGDCSGCHPVHKGKGAPAVGMVACTRCHNDARSDKSFHNGASCRDCHRPHGKLLSKAREPFCVSCHAKRVGDAPAIRPSKGHSRCPKCHVRAAHDTKRKPASCVICHKKHKRAAAKGLDCRGCHETHSGEIRKGAPSGNPH
jgi:predicted CXXCH cytochrome family protein